MSAPFRHAKQKPTQQELRRLMSEQKLSNATKGAAAAGAAQRPAVDSPLAKYNEAGQLQCVLCKTTVRSADVWRVHVNAKLHRQNVEVAKQLQAKTNNFTTNISAAALKRPAATPTATETAAVPEKKIKGILKNSTAAPPTQTLVAPATNDGSQASSSSSSTSSAIPSDFFVAPAAPSESKLSYYEATMQKTSIRQDLLNIHRESFAAASSMEVDAPAPTATSAAAAAADEVLPEGFFDDPVKDAKARNQEYHDPAEQEWEKFQKEMKAAAEQSDAIIEDDQVEATAERQIDEIDEQMRNWSRVVSLEKKKELVRSSMAKRRALAAQAKADANGADTVRTSDDDDTENADDAEDDNLDEFLDWRSKKSHLRGGATK